MLRLLFSSALVTGILVGSCSDTNVSKNAIAYPKTRKGDSVDTYFGVKVADPYRWLEDDNSDSTKAWVTAENKVTFDYLSKIPYRDKIKQRLREIWNYEKTSAPYRKGKRYFYSRNNGVQNQSVLYYKDSLAGAEKQLLDPNTFSTDGTVSLSGWDVSQDGKYMAYSLSKAGSDWNEYYVLDISTGQKMSDHLEWVKFSGTGWKGNGFFYSRYDEPKGSQLTAKNDHQKLYFHTLGQDQKNDLLIHKDDAHPERSFSPQISDDQRWLVVYTSESTTGNGLMVKDLSKPNSPLITINDEHKDEYGVLDVRGTKMLVRTNKNAPRYRLIEIDLLNPQEANWKEIIPQREHPMESVILAGSKIVTKYLVDVKSQMIIFDSLGKQEKEIPIPTMSSVAELSGDRKDKFVFYSLSSFTAPPSIYKYDLTTGSNDLFSAPKIDFKSDDYETKQVFFASKDGTKVPMFITHKKGLKLDGTNPTFLFGYGGFGLHYGPEFRIDRAVFLEAGGVYAVANMRGGDEYGEEWHQAGTKCKKQNVFDDFIGAAEFLIKEKYTSSEKLAVQGRSNGGLLIGAVMTQRPELFKVCIPMVGVLDMLRYHRFTIGRYWSTDYGLSENKEEFDCLYKYSPLHNVKKVSYPATLVTTGDHDDRVVPAH